MNIYRCIARYP